MHDRAAANAIAASLLEKSNPDTEASDEEVAAAKVTELFETLDMRGVQASSLRESDLRRYCRELNLDDTQTAEAVEEWMSWAGADGA